MTKRKNSLGIVLKRVDYGEADRILTFFTEQFGKRTVMAKGVRRPKSKLAGGIELFSICEIGFIEGRSDINTLVSSRMKDHFEHLVKDYDRMTLAYDLIRVVDKMTDDDAGSEYYELLAQGLRLLNNTSLDPEIAGAWAFMQAMKLNGSLPDLLRDSHANELKKDAKYSFSTEDGAFFASEFGQFGEQEIKAWRVFAAAEPEQLSRISGLAEPARKSLDTIKHFAEFMTL